MVADGTVGRKFWNNLFVPFQGMCNSGRIFRLTGCLFESCFSDVFLTLEGRVN